MSGWLNNLKNLQGQLTELASEVLNEATEEIADPESEVQVLRRKCTEFEAKFNAEQSRVEGLTIKIADIEGHLEVTRAQLDASTTKYTNIISDRDGQIKKLQIELEKALVHGGTEDDHAEEEMNELRKEVAHWKALVSQANQVSSEWAKKLAELQKEKEEMASVFEAKEKQLVDRYEERISTLTGCAASGSESSGDILDAVLLEKEELLEEKKRLEDELNRRKQSAERAVLVDVREREEDRSFDSTQPNYQAEEELKLLRERVQHYEAREVELERLRAQNNELTLAYNDLNNELEAYKERNGSVTNNNRDLTNRIDALKANLIEYEERYELCKRENAETLKQLERLSGDFERLRAGLSEAKSRSEHTDASLSGEVDKLRSALEQSKEDRDRLRVDVDKFRSAINNIGDELSGLRRANNQLIDENGVLSAQLEKYDDSMKDALKRSEEELRGFRLEFDNLQHLQLTKENEYARVLEEYEGRAADMEAVLASLRAENAALKMEVSEREGGARTQEPSDNDRIRSLETVSTLTEQLREALSANTEITEECERLRREKEELDKEISVRQNCIDEMIAQTSVLQLQQQQQAAAHQQLRTQLSEKEKTILEMEVELAHASQREMSREAEDTSIYTQQIAELQERAARVEAEKEQLRQFMTAKHDESLGYYNRLDAAMRELAALQARDAALLAERDMERERSEKAQRELLRLKEHLLMIEETSTREAIEAEARETALLSRVRALEEASAAEKGNAEETCQSSQARISALETSLAAAERDAAESRSRLELKGKEHSEASQALTSLQNVVRELASEHEKEFAQASHKAMELQIKVQERERETASLREELDRLQLEKQAAEEEAEAARQRENAKQNIIDDLEVRLSESAAAAASSSSSYRVDDATLRQLFLSYFTALPDKRPDIALLLTSILEYPPEDVEKVRNAVRPGGGAVRMTSGPSITEQFVRFLERESESSRDAMSLPLRTESTRLSSPADLPSPQVSSSESASALREMLQERPSPAM